MVDSTKLIQIAKFVAPALVLVWLITTIATPQRTLDTILRSFKDEKKIFVADFLEHEVDGAFDGSKIAQLCASRKWAPQDKALILTCEPQSGGVGEVKNGHLTCIRFAMEIGAQLVLPRISKRADHDITKLVSGPAKGLHLDYMFDAVHLKQSLATFCPQMKIWDSVDELFDQPTFLVPLKVKIGDLIREYVNETIISHPSFVRTSFDTFVQQRRPEKDGIKQHKYPLHIHLATPLFTWPTAYDGAGFAQHFGRMLRAREDIKLLAASALYNLLRMFNLRDENIRTVAIRNSFVGVHLRTEKDVKGKFPDYAAQAANYLAFVTANHAPAVYLATGATDQDVQRLVARAAEFNVTVVSKKDLLNNAELTLLDDFTWDQRALIDYEVMLRAGAITGTAHSSFMWNLAMRRHAVYGKPGEATKPTGPSAMMQWQDKYSTIYGSSPNGGAMELGIWP